MVMCVFREEVYKPDDLERAGVTDIMVAKQRNGPNGCQFATTVEVQILCHLRAIPDHNAGRDSGSSTRRFLFPDRVPGAPRAWSMQCIAPYLTRQGEIH